MTSEEIVRRVLSSLEAVGIPYVLVGSLASNVYGIVRSTQDADLVVQTDAGHVQKLMDSLGPAFRRDPQMSFETVTGTQKIAIRELSTGFMIELFELSSDAHDQERFARRQRIRIFDFEAWVLTAEDVLVTKLNWLSIANRPKDRADIQGVIGVMGDAIDWLYVEHWCDEHGSRSLLEKIREQLRK